MSTEVSQKSTLSLIIKYLQVILFGGLILYFGKTLFIPAFFGLLVAIVMYPVCKQLEHRHWPRSLATTLALSIVIIIFITLIWLLGLEVNYLLRDIPAIAKRIEKDLPDIQSWVFKTTSVSIDVQNTWLDKAIDNLQSSITATLSSAFGATAGTIFMLIMIPIYAALFLYQRETFVRYLERISGPAFKDKLHTILQQTTFTYYRFVRGTFMVYIIVGILNSIGLLALGIRHALLYGMLTAFMTIIPYAGIIISSLLPISTAILTKNTIWHPLGIIAVFTFVQYLEANVIFPRVVGSQLNVSTWAMLVAIFIGTILWGVAGMILFIPFVAIFKIVTDHIDELKSINILLSREKKA
ncbi:MAG: AI-2E family transporter [Bacteroidetes bacterium]|nr:AI-2E family transporter [Bacteroidota bacterium]